MLSEKRSDGNNWKTKLDELNSLPDESASSTSEAWEKLHLRLNGNIRRPKAAWYWIAAACISILLCPVPWSKFIKVPELVKNNSAVFQNKKPYVPVATAYKEEIKQDISYMHVKSKPALYSVEKRKAAVIAIEKDSTNSSGLSVSTHPPAVLTQLTAIKASIIDTAVMNTPLVFAKKKLRVVHINELGVAVEEEAIQERYAERLPYYRRLANQNQDLLSNTSINSRSFSNDIFKLRISPQN